jgi:hypothetical protein
MIFESLGENKLIEHKQRIAFHEAGHATAIYLNNKAKILPPVHFKIIIKEFPEKGLIANQSRYENCIARVEGGRLIDLLSTIDELVHKASDPNEAMVHLVREYMTAFELDIINLLIGPLAEAKYVANIDDELFNQQLLHLKALHTYGGSSYIALANEYINSFYTRKEQRDEKLDELFTIAFNFINDKASWAAVTKLAKYIIDSNKNIISHEEVSALLACHANS